MKRPTIILTGGGTAGHVSVNEALIPVFLEKGYTIHYIGSHKGIEKDLIQQGHPEVIYHPIQSGKLRRYFSLKNFTDPFRVLAGVGQALAIIRKVQPEFIFSKGGFVSVPVVMAGKLTRTPVTIHESDVTPGLANKLALPFSNQIFTVFEETLQYVDAKKSTCSGAIIRPHLFEGDREIGLQLTAFSGERPILLITGGSQGSQQLNEQVRQSIKTITASYDCIHLVGKGNVDSVWESPNYRQYEYVTDELAHLLAAADYVVSRAGSNAIFEFLALQKPMLLIPLSAAQSRGDQLLNAAHFQSLGIAQVVQEEELPTIGFDVAVQKLIEHAPSLIQKMKQVEQPKTPTEMADLILKYK